MNKLTLLTPRALTLAVLLTVGVVALAPLPRAFAKDAPAKSFNAALDASLIAAVNTSNASEVRKLLGRNANPNARDKTAEGTTALGRAATVGNLEIVKMLVEAGAEVESGSVAGLSPLAIAALNNRNEVLFYLLEKGAKVNSNGYKGLTALMFAASAGNAQGVRALLRAGANVNARSAAKGTPLFFGSTKTDGSQGTLEVVKILVEAGADLFATTDNGKNAFTMAQDDGLDDIARYLYAARKPHLDLYNAGKSSNGTKSVSWSDARQLLDMGAKGYTTNKSGENALMLFSLNAKDFDETIAKRLIAVSDVNARAKSGATALHFAAQAGQENLVALLIASGANLSVVSDKGNAPLDSAWKFPTIATLLRNAGAKSGKTTIVAATPATPSQEDMGWALATALMSGKTDKKAENSPQATAPQTTPTTAETPATPVSAQDMALFEAMEKIYNKRYSGGLSDADWAPVEKLLNEGASAHYANKYGRTALIMASYKYDGTKGTDAMLKKLIARADLNAKDDEGNTALHNAAIYGNRQMVALLIEAGADLNLRNNGGKTPRDWAVQQGDAVILDSLTKAAAAKSQGKAGENYAATTAPLLIELQQSKFDAAAAEKLLLAGADIQTADAQGKTALMLASAAGTLDAVQWLLSKNVALNAADARGMTALMVAAERAGDDISMAIVTELLDADADYELKNKEGKTAFDLAKAKGNAASMFELSMDDE